MGRGVVRRTGGIKQLSVDDQQSMARLPIRQATDTELLAAAEYTAGMVAESADDLAVLLDALGIGLDELRALRDP
jgi:hypothetical protein